MKKIHAEEISVVFQGPIHTRINDAVFSIKHFLPGAEIIISTWKNSSCGKLNVDKIIFNEDPGGIIASNDGFVDNINRMILSSKEGILASSRKFVLKMRTDCILLGTSFLSYFYQFPEREKEWCVYSQRILVPSTFTRPQKYEKDIYLYHPSDWVGFGLREDMISLWDVPMPEQPYFSQYFKEKNYSPWSKFYAEQYVFIASMEKNGHSTFVEHRKTFSEKLGIRSQKYLMNNFLILDYQVQFNFINIKYPQTFFHSKIQRHIDFLLYYQEFCDKNYIIPISEAWKHVLQVQNFFDKIERHLSRIIKNRKRPLLIIGQLCGIIYYYCIIIIRIILLSYRLIYFLKGYKK